MNIDHIKKMNKVIKPRRTTTKEVADDNALKARQLLNDGLTTAEVARILEVSTATVLNYKKRVVEERGERAPTLGYLGLNNNRRAQRMLDRMQTELNNERD